MGQLRVLLSVVLGAMVFMTGSSRAQAVMIYNVSGALDHFANSADYRVRPLEGSGKPLVVNVSMYIRDIHKLDDMKLEFSATLYLRRKWNDPRLQFESGNGKLKQLTLAGDHAHTLIWIPDLFFSNAHIVQVGSTDKINSGVKVKPSGDVIMSTMYTITSKCPLRLELFPFDKQICYLHIESYFYDSSGITLNWSRSSSAAHVDSSALEFKTHTVEQVTTSKEVTKLTTVFTESYEKLLVQITFQRSYGHYILMIYLPSFLLVLLSCLLFWMPIQSLAERTFFGAFLFLAMIIIHGSTQFGTPQTSYIRAIDVWTVSCLFFLTVAILEVVVLHLIAKGSGFATTTDHIELVNEDGGTSQTSVKLGPFTIQYVSIKRADLVLSVVYPSAWILFNIIYWSIY